MRPTRRSAADLAILVVVVLAGLSLWLIHASAWDLGRDSTVLTNESSQYAVAARELAEHGRLATPFALPIELARTARPPWPLASLQPGLVVAEAAIFRLAPRVIRFGDVLVFNLQVPSQREWLTLLIPFFCYLTLGVLLALVTARLLDRHAPGTTPVERRVAALTIGLAFLLDPEAQQLAAGGVNEMPFTLGLAGAFAALVSERAAQRRPLLFGLLLGVTGAFNAGMLWLLPVFALAAAALAPGRRAQVALLTLLGFSLPLLPWWFYKWRAFGSPAFDLSRLLVWEDVQGRSWFRLVHLPDLPALPAWPEAGRLLVVKVARRLPGLLLDLASGPRALWAGALLFWALSGRASRPLGVTAWSILAVSGLMLVGAAATIPWLRFLFPARIALETAGMLALWGLIAAAPATMIGPRLGRALSVGVAVLALAWGVHQTMRGNAEARTTAAARGTPSVLTLRDIAFRLRQRIPAEEVVMSNLGPMLSWYSGRPVVHLALSPDDVAACRRRLEFRNVVLAFRDPEQAWPAWAEVIERPADAVHQPGWNIIRERHWQAADGFHVVWLELGPPEGRLAALPRPPGRGDYRIFTTTPVHRPSVVASLTK